MSCAARSCPHDSAAWYAARASPSGYRPGQQARAGPLHRPGEIRDYSSHPGAADIAMVVEIADSSLADDRKMASEVYGRAGIPVYWIVHVVDRQVEVYHRSGRGGLEAHEGLCPGRCSRS